MWVRWDHKSGTEKRLRREGSFGKALGKASWRRSYVSWVRKVQEKGRVSKCTTEESGHPNP